MSLMSIQAKWGLLVQVAPGLQEAAARKFDDVLGPSKRSDPISIASAFG